MRERGALAPYAAAATGAILFGAGVVATRSIAHAVPLAVLAWMRFLPGAIALTLLMPRRPTAREAAAFVGLGSLFFAVFPVTFQLALQHTVSAHGALVLALGPMATAVLARLILHEKMGRLRLVGLMVALVGIALLFLDSGLLRVSKQLLLGDVLMLIPMLCASLYVVLGQPLFKRFGGLASTGCSMAAGSLLLLPVVLSDLGAVAALTPQQWAVVAFLAFPSGVIAFALWNWANAKLPPGRVGVFINLNPLTASLLGALVLGEQVSPLMFAALACVVGGIVLVTIDQPRRARR